MPVQGTFSIPGMQLYIPVTSGKLFLSVSGCAVVLQYQQSVEYTSCSMRQDLKTSGPCLCPVVVASF